MGVMRESGLWGASERQEIETGRER